MNRVKRIATRGWLDKAVQVFTFGYYPPNLLVRGKLCIGAITMTIPSMVTTFALPKFAMAMSIPDADIAMSLPSLTTAMAKPTMLIDIEDCP